mmetsp:Transcript_160752/g.390515  ORF Transcript_160752/g.390515 Transcript_160752/m.390515 type:complete len:85 (+) Transcript_160752:177-431(+)
MQSAEGLGLRAQRQLTPQRQLGRCCRAVAGRGRTECTGYSRADVVEAPKLRGEAQLRKLESERLLRSWSPARRPGEEQPSSDWA